MKNLCLEAICAELDAVGIEYAVNHGGKHIRIEWEHAGEPRLMVCALTPSDRRAHMNSRSDVRAILRTDGLIGDGEIAPVEHLLTVRSGEPVADSRMIADHFSRNHKDVLRAIDRAVAETDEEFNGRNFAPVTYTDKKGQDRRAYELTRDGFSYVVMGFTGQAASKWKVRYISAFNAMERELAARETFGDEIVSKAELRGEIDALLSLIPETKSKAAFIPPRIQQRRDERRACRRAA